MEFKRQRAIHPTQRVIIAASAKATHAGLPLIPAAEFAELALDPDPLEVTDGPSPGAPDPPAAADNCAKPIEGGLER
jgi:hypothetical protein